MFRRHWTFWIIFAFLGILFLSTLRPSQDWGGDFSIYVLQARNFVGHRPFDQNTYITTPESRLNHPSVYPPLTSIVLAPVYAARGIDYAAFKAVLTTFLWLCMPLYYLLLQRQGLSPGAAAFSVLIFGTSSLVLGLRAGIGSDSLYLFVLGLALLFIVELYRKGWDERHPVPAALLTAALLMLCYLTRATGLALIAGFGIYELGRTRRLRLFGVVAIAATALALVLYTTFAFHAGHQYGSQFPFRPRAYVANIAYYLRSSAAIWAASPRLLRYPLAFITLLLAAIGLIRKLFKPTVVECYIVLSLAVLVTYSLVSDVRYMVPLIPFMIAYAVEQILTHSGKLVRPWRTVALAVPVVLTVFAAALNLRAIETGPIQEGVSQPEFLEACSFLKTHTPETGLILSWNPRLFALYTDKPSALYARGADPPAVPEDIRRRRPAFLVYYDGDDMDRELLLPYLQGPGRSLAVAFENARYRIYALPEPPR